jgi:hypothetical protein
MEDNSRRGIDNCPKEEAMPLDPNPKIFGRLKLKAELNLRCKQDRVSCKNNPKLRYHILLLS